MLIYSTVLKLFLEYLTDLSSKLNPFRLDYLIILMKLCGWVSHLGGGKSYSDMNRLKGDSHVFFFHSSLHLVWNQIKLDCGFRFTVPP